MNQAEDQAVASVGINQQWGKPQEDLYKLRFDYAMKQGEKVAEDDQHMLFRSYDMLRLSQKASADFTDKRMLLSDMKIQQVKADTYQRII